MAKLNYIFCILCSILLQLLCSKMSVKGMIEGISGECESIIYLVEI